MAGRTFNMMKVVKVRSTHSAAYFRVGDRSSSASVAEILNRVEADSALDGLRGNDDHKRKLVVVLGFASIRHCGATMGPGPQVVAVVSQFHLDGICENRQGAVYAHELGHAFGLGHLNDRTLMHEPYVCNAKLLSECNLNSSQRSYLINQYSRWFVSAAASAASLPDSVPYEESPADDPLNRTTPLYKYVNYLAADNFYTVWRNDAELASLGWAYDGCEASVFTQPEPGTVPLRRWYNSHVVDHYYTVDDTPELVYFGYVSEPDEGYVARYDAPAEGLVPLYRYYSSLGTDHYYTVDRNDAALASLSYAFERIEAYVVPPPSGRCR